LGLELARRAAASHRASDGGKVLKRFAAEARRQSDTLEELRARAAAIAFHMGEDRSGSSA
jgi:hypothetical protein